MSETKLFPALLKYWRARRDYSQLQLALAAGVSARHLSFLESGRTRPSEGMVLRLLHCLQLPQRDQNEMLRSASFGVRHPEPSWDDIDPHISQAMTRMLSQHEPYPMTVVDGGYTVLRSNGAAQRLFGHFVADLDMLAGPMNVFDLVFDPARGRAAVQNWAELGRYMVARLHREALQRPEDERLPALLQRVLAYPGVPASWRQPDFSLHPEPTVSVVLARGPLVLRFFMVLTAFASVQQSALEELRIESYFPADEATREICERWRVQAEAQ